jgi:hypothetical protein
LQTFELSALEYDAAGARREQTYDRAYSRGLAHAVAAKQRNDLARAHFEIDIEKNLASAIRVLEALDAEHQSFPAKIRRPHVGVALDLVGRTDRDSAAVCEHGYSVREAKYGINVMLDE